jgi:hypothetical protein
MIARFGGELDSFVTSRSPNDATTRGFLQLHVQILVRGSEVSMPTISRAHLLISLKCSTFTAFQLSVRSINVVRFWLELFDHDRQLSIDSAGDCVIEDAAIAAKEFIARATKLSENPHAWRRSSQSFIRQNDG